MKGPLVGDELWGIVEPLLPPETRQARETRSHRLVSGVVVLGERSGEKGGEKTGPNPVDRGRPGSKRHLLVDGVEPVKGPKGRLKKHPDKLHADKAYDFLRCRRFLRMCGIKAHVAKRGIDSSERLGRHRWTVERTLAWLSCYRRLCVR